MQVLRRQFIEQIRHCASSKNHPEILVFQGETAYSLSLLEWLKAQSLFPQFYFKSRTQQHTWAALGEVRSFFDAFHAEQFVQQSHFPLVGGLTFDKQAYFFLPRFLLSQTGNKTQVQFFVHRDELAEQDTLIEYLQTLEKFTALSPLKQEITALSCAANQATWSNWVESALNHIQEGQLDKVVLANKQTYQTDSLLNAMDLLAESENKNSGCYHFLLAQQADSVFIGSSPERLYQRLGQQLHTEALAGTATISDDLAQNQHLTHWLLQDKKNIVENQLVAEGICLALQPYAEHIQVADLTVKTLRQVMHLYREITAILKPMYSDQICLQALHPTAAVSGLPQSSAINFIQNTENFDRTWYAGTLGIMQSDSAEFCVTIRSAVIEAESLSVFAGAGIVEGSIPLLEWQEIERKATGLLSLFKDKQQSA
ncbi:MAG: isochorismate synthase [Lonepinella koalarum]|nr:isochorismate synthase [Lonepinella koalarum]